MIRVLFVSSAWYSVPLDRNSQNKFSLLSKYMSISLIGQGRDFYPHIVNDVMRVYLAPYRASWIFRRFLYIWYARQWIQKSVARGIDVIVAQSPLEAALISFVIPRINRPKVIVELHGEWFRAPLLYKNIRSRFISRCMNLVHERGLRAADAFRVVSVFLEHELRARHAVDNRPVYHFPAYTDFDLFLSVKPNFRHNTILFVGQLTYLKGIQYLLRAVAIARKSISDLRCIIVGDGDYKSELRRLANDLAITPFVYFRGDLSQEMVKNEMENSLVLVLPSISEGLGRVLLEAQAAGIPVIGSEVGGIPETMKDKETGFIVSPRNSEVIAQKLIYFASDHNMARLFGKRGRKFIQASFSIEQYINQYKTMIFEVCVG